MNYRQIIGEAWVFTQENKKLLVWYAFIPSILTTVVGAFYLVYQFYAFKSSALFEHWQQSFTVLVLKEVWQVAQEHLGSLLPVFIILGILAILYFLLPPVSEGAIIQLIARKKNNQNVRRRDGIRYGFLSFLSLFNYSWIARSFNIISIGGEASLLLRNVNIIGVDLLNILVPILIIFAVASIILMMLFVFTEYFIVIDDCKVTESMAKSAVLVVKHWDTALMVSILMMFIAIRILLQIIFVLMVPVGILMLIFYFAASTMPFIGLIIGGVIAVIALIFASYLGAIVHIFTSAVWVFTFLKLTNAPDISAREQQSPAS